MSLGENIARLRSQKGWSQEELAGALAVSRQSVSKWETDASVPDLDKLMKLSEVFGVSLDVLVRGGPDPDGQRASGEGLPPAGRMTDGPAREVCSPAGPAVAAPADAGARAPVFAGAPQPPDPRPTPAGRAGVSGVQKLAALVLLLCGLAVFFFFLLLEGSAAGVIFAVPFWLCAAICAVCRKNAGLWCAWAVYFCGALFLRLATGISWRLVLLTPRYEAGWNYARLIAAWVELAVILALLAATVLRFRRLPLATGRDTAIALVAGWLGFLLARAAGEFIFDAFFRFTGFAGPLGFLYALFGFAKLAALAVLLCFSARFLHSRRRG